MAQKRCQKCGNSTASIVTTHLVIEISVKLYCSLYKQGNCITITPKNCVPIGSDPGDSDLRHTRRGRYFLLRKRTSTGPWEWVDMS